MNIEVEWKLKGVTGNELKELQSARMFSADDLTLSNVFLILPTGQEIPKGHALTFRNAYLSCGVCKKDFKVDDFQLGVTDSLFMEPDIESQKRFSCSHCESTKEIWGIETSAADESPRYWVVIKRYTHPASYPVNLMRSEGGLDSRLKFSVEIYTESGPLPESETKIPPQAKVVSIHKEDLPTVSVSSFTTPGTSLGIRFDIDKIKSQSSGLYGYGVESWKVFWQSIDSQKLKGVTLSEGDTSATLSGRENVYCIAVQANSDTLNEIKTALENSAEFQQVAALTKFIEGSGLAGEPLMDAGQVDLTGNFVGEENIPPHTAFGIVQRKKQSSSTAAQSSPPTAKPVEQPKEIDTEVIQESKKKGWQFWKS